MTRTDGVSPKRQSEPVGAIALILGLALMILPTEGEILWMLHREGRTAFEWVIWFACFIVVVVPFAVSWRRLRCCPGRWRRGKENLILTGCILTLNVFFLIVASWCNVI